MLRFLTGGKRTEDVKPMDVQERLQRGESVLILDVREPDEYRDAHVRGSTLIPLGQLSHRLGDLPRDRTIVTLCRSGNRSGVAAGMLTRAGFTDVVNLAGGIIAWQRQGLPVERGR